MRIPELSKQLIDALKDRAAYAEWSQGKIRRGVAMHDVEKLVEEMEGVVQRSQVE